MPPSALSSLGTEDLARALRPLWEDATPLATRLQGRHFETWHELIDTVEEELPAASQQWREALVAAHPRLGEDPEVLQERSQASWAEQGCGSDPGTALRLKDLNDRYEARFGFPFVEWVAGRPMSQIAEVLEARLGNDRSEELARACAALLAIARDRLKRIEAQGGTAL